MVRVRKVDIALELVRDLLMVGELLTVVEGDGLDRWSDLVEPIQNAGCHFLGGLRRRQSSHQETRATLHQGNDHLAFLLRTDYGVAFPMADLSAHVDTSRAGVNGSAIFDLTAAVGVTHPSLILLMLASQM